MFPEPIKPILKSAYESDASQIEGSATQVVFPKTIADILKVVKNGKKILVRGGGSSLVGSAVPQEAIVLDMSKMNSILEINPEKRYVVVQAGIILDKLNKELEKYNLEFPIQPSSHGICTIGGMISTNASGNRAIKYGYTSQWIEEIEIINGKGEIKKIDKALLSDYVAMEGTTGIIVNAKLKLSPKVERTATMFASEDRNKILSLIKSFRLKKEVSAIEILDKLTSKILDLGEKYHLIIEFESNEGSLKEKDYKKMWNLRDSAYPKLAFNGYIMIEDPKFFLEKIPEFMSWLESKNIPYFGHIGVGILHPCFKKDEEEKIEEMYSIVKKLRGVISGEHGIGLKKKKYLEIDKIKLLSKIKLRNDPEDKLNSGKIFDLKKDSFFKDKKKKIEDDSK